MNGMILNQQLYNAFKLLDAGKRPSKVARGMSDPIEALPVLCTYMKMTKEQRQQIKEMYAASPGVTTG